MVDVRDDGVVLAPLPGRELRALGSDPTTTVAELSVAWHGVGRLLQRLAVAAGEVRGALPWHDAAREADRTRAVVDGAVAGGWLPARDLTPILTDLAGGRTPAAHAIAHGDLHDGQVLVGAAGSLAVRHPATLAVAEPALDLASLLAHLELRAAQGTLPAARRRVAVDALLRGADPDATTFGRLPAYTRAAKLRLCADHATRPASCDLALRWWDALTS